MRRSLGLYRRPSGIYAVRISIPKRHRPLLNKTEVHISTGSRELNSAIIESFKIQLVWKEKLMALEDAKQFDINPLLFTGGNIGLIDAAKLLSLDINLLLNEIKNHQIKLYTTVSNLGGLQINNIDDVEKDYDNTFIINSVEDKGFEARLSGELRLFDLTHSISSLLKNQSTLESIFMVDNKAAIFPTKEVKLNLVQIECKKRDIEALRKRFRYIEDKIQKSNPSTSTPTLSTLAVDPITAKHGKKLFSDLFKSYQKSKSWGEDQKRRMATETGLFIDLMGDLSLELIDTEAILNFAEKLSKVPSDIYQTRRKYRVDKIDELIEIAQREKLELKKQLTISNHIDRISEVFNYAVRTRLMPFNPAATFKTTSPKKAFKKSHDDRDIFSEEELRLIFSQTWFKTGKGDFNKNGSTNWRPFYYWLPLLAVHTGGRLNELSQLYLKDIKQFSDENIYFIDFNLDGDGKLEADDKSLKTVNSIRVVPIHSSLIELGFIDYVTQLRDYGEMRLFPELSYDRIKGYGKAAGSWFNERFLGGTLKIERNGKKTFHSFRHTFLTAIERLNQPEQVLAQLAGHQKGATESFKRYAKDRDAKELSPVINRLSFDFMNCVHQFDTKAGLKAVKYSAVLKSRIKRSKLIR